MIRRAKRQESDQGRVEAEFLSLLAHELRNPMAPILSSAAVLRMLGGTEAQLRAVEIIDRQCRHLSRLVDDLVDGARLQRGLVTLERREVDIGEIAEQALAAVQPKVDAKSQHVAAQLIGLPIRMVCDPARLRQILDNLLDNASLYTQAGGSISLEVAAQERELQIRVSDNGMGISQEALPQVFNMYARMVAETRGHRLGVGLAITRGLVELHGGAIRADSAGPGRGSAFIVTLPLLAEPPNRRRTARRTSVASPLRILVVDDNIDAANSLADLLTLEGHVVQLATDAAAALHAAQAFRPTVVLLDIVLPDSDGYVVAKQLRAQLDSKALRLIALTAYGSAPHRSRTRAAGFDSHLTKPVSPEALRKALAAKS